MARYPGIKIKLKARTIKARAKTFSLPPTKKMSHPAVGNFIRIKSDGTPTGEFLIEDSDGNPIDIPILSISWSIDSGSLGKCMIETIAEVDIKAAKEATFVKIKGAKTHMNIQEFIDGFRKK